jgi:hypothetical protein
MAASLDRERFPLSVLDVSDAGGESVVTVRAAEIVPICRFLRDEPDLGYDLCVFVSGLDQSAWPLRAPAAGGKRAVAEGGRFVAGVSSSIR